MLSRTFFVLFHVISYHFAHCSAMLARILRMSWDIFISFRTVLVCNYCRNTFFQYNVSIQIASTHKKHIFWKLLEVLQWHTHTTRKLPALT